MSRTKGAKNLPKELENELAKLAQLYKDRGIEFPLRDPAVTSESPAVILDRKDKAGRRDSDGKISFRVSDNRGDKQGSPLECGNCQHALDSQYPVCPWCGAHLTWSE